MSRKAILACCEVNTDKATHATYFPYPESTTKTAYSAGVNGCTGCMRFGDEFGIRYACGPYANDWSGSKIRELGNRERRVLEYFSHCEELEYSDNGKYSLLSFVSIDGYRFDVATFDNGHTWKICG